MEGLQHTEFGSLKTFFFVKERLCLNKISNYYLISIQLITIHGVDIISALYRIFSKMRESTTIELVIAFIPTPIMTYFHEVSNIIKD